MCRRVEKKWDGSGGQGEQALGRSRGGFGTKIHGGFNGLGQPVELLVTPGQASDIAQADTLLADHTPEVVIADRGYDAKALVETIEGRGGEAVIADKGYDSDAFVAAVEARGAEAVIPPLGCRKRPRP